MGIHKFTREIMGSWERNKHTIPIFPKCNLLSSAKFGLLLNGPNEESPACIY